MLTNLWARPASSRTPVSRLGVLAGLVAAGAIAVSTPGAADAAISSCALSSLPAQATQTVNLIHKGGPFPYPNNDGVVFTNREGILPAQSSSYYHEYTVPTPGASNRGTRRIVTGGTPLTSPPHYYYTGDHYDSFCSVTGA
ncbi:ribonuclease domain-containing protein [Williamsia maris]|uniref:Guanyl-specific ribonuclease Sa n=1 Tax=Williamsia maris TaxID=72806 RepID=A0ABT1HGP2_9NOCA|nr:ribonuclease domain-containing protein [Williamsia maris]MCP2176160.1 Guanyl-specific ribonuclease Sa [Williamsia maris]